MHLNQGPFMGRKREGPQSEVIDFSARLTLANRSKNLPLLATFILSELGKS